MSPSRPLVGREPMGLYTPLAVNSYKYGINTCINNLVMNESARRGIDCFSQPQQRHQKQKKQ